MSRVFYFCRIAAVLVIPGLGLSYGTGAARRDAPVIARYSGQTGGIEWIKTTTTTAPGTRGVLRERLVKPEARAGAVRG